jgi:hypothetical protein
VTRLAALLCTTEFDACKMIANSLDIRADDVELQELLNDGKRESGLLQTPTTTTMANDAGDAAEDEELLIKKRPLDDSPPKLPWLQLLFYLVMRASSYAADYSDQIRIAN